MTSFKLLAIVAFVIALTSCRHPSGSIDGISGATVPHAQIILPPTNSHYRVLGHLEGLNNYVVRYDDTLYRGGQAYAEDLAAEALHECGIKTIISIVPSPEEQAFCASNGFAMVAIPFEKDGPTTADLTLYFRALEKGEGPFYVHCKGGTHRAGILAAAYRIKFQNWTFEQAIIEYGRLGGDLKADHVLVETLRTIKTTSK